MDWFEGIIESSIEIFPLLFDDGEEKVYSIFTDDAEKRESRGGSRPNINRKFRIGHQKLLNDYFTENPTYDEGTFLRRFRIPKSMFCQITHDLQGYDDFFTLCCDAAGKVGLTTIKKCTAALRMLAYGSSANSLDENIRIGESTTLQTLRKFCAAIIDVYGAEFLRRPTFQDRERLMAQNAERGFPGMLGSIDCMHWSWKNCPVALKGQYQGKEGRPTIVLEAMASRDGYIWHSFLVVQGAAMI